MVKTKYIIRNISVLNFILAAVVVVMAVYALLPQLYADIKYLMPAQKKTRDVELSETTAAAAHVIHSLSDYVAVAEDNLFHPERKLPPEKMPEEKPLPKPEFAVYGTIISDDISLAFLEDLKAPVTTTGRGKRQITLREGDVFSGFTLREVQADKIVMVRGEEKISVKVHKDRARKETPAPADKADVVQPAASTPQKPAPAVRRAPMTPAEERVRAFFTK